MRCDVMCWRAQGPFTQQHMSRIRQTLLEDNICDGGTDLENLVFPEGYDCYLLCTDGLSTLGPTHTFKHTKQLTR